MTALERSRYARDPETYTADRFTADLSLLEESLSAGVTPRDVRRAAWWPISVTGRRTSWRSRSRQAPAGTPHHETSRAVDELVG